MPEWLLPILQSWGPALITGVVAYAAGSRRNRHDLIDQLQEERDKRSEEIEKLNIRITAFYTDKHASRQYVAALLDAIWQRKEPPPPEPPTGYIP